MPWLRWLALSFAVVILASAMQPLSASAASLQDQISAARDRQAELTKAISHSEQLVAELKAAEQSTAQDLKDIRADLVATRERIDKVKERLARIRERHTELLEEQRQTDFTLSLLEQELANGEADLKQRRDALGQRLVEAYRSESTSLVEQVFTAQSFSDVLSDTSAYLAYGDQDAQMARQITQDQQALDSLRLLTTSTRLRTDQLRRETEDTWAQVQDLNRQLAKAKRRLEVLQKKTEKAKERQEAQMRLIIKNKKQAAAAARAARAQREALRAKIGHLVAAMQARATATFGGGGGVRAGSGGGYMVWPANGYISQDYGCTGFPTNPPLGSCAHFHTGIDIAGSSGSPIVAAAAGIVAYAGWNPYEAVPAYIVVIAHGGGLSTLYAHMLPTGTVHAGSVVRKGQLIGRMGSTGNSTGTHLHFEVWSGGDWSPVNPRAYL